jgi:hypothetical protein
MELTDLNNIAIDSISRTIQDGSQQDGLNTKTESGDLVPTDKGMELTDMTDIDIDSIPRTNQDEPHSRRPRSFLTESNIRCLHVW